MKHFHVLPIALFFSFVVRSSAAAAAASSTSSSASTTAATTAATTASSLPSIPKSSPAAPVKRITLKHVQVVHRHGDRTPITPMRNSSYWESILPPNHVLDGIQNGTRLVHDENSIGGHSHAAGGRGPFGQLSQLGLLQMVDLGSRLREELHFDVGGNEDRDDDDVNAQMHHEDEHGNQHMYKGKLFFGEAPIHPTRVKVTSTNFPRTVQSVQGLLVGMFPETGEEHQPISIDVTKTMDMIPDPQPRRTVEQIELERSLAQRPHLKQREEEMKGLAVRATEALRDSLAEGYEKFIFGVGEENGSDDDNHRQTKPLAWSQLAEVTTCLRSRDLLPEAISHADQEAISSHAAWRWFESLRHPRLARLAMYPMVQEMVQGLHRSKECPRKGTKEDEPLLHIFSAHDSTLMGLICAFHLQQPSQWPHYASFLKLELLEVENMTMESEKEYFVRFSLNGEVLRSAWSMDESGKLHDLVSLDRLTEMVNKEHSEDEIAVTAE